MRDIDNFEGFHQRNFEDILHPTIVWLEMILFWGILTHQWRCCYQIYFIVALNNLIHDHTENIIVNLHTVHSESHPNAKEKIILRVLKMLMVLALRQKWQNICLNLHYMCFVHLLEVIGHWENVRSMTY